MPTLITQRNRGVAMGWNSALTANTATPLEVLGATRYESEGRVFVYVLSAGALILGDSVRLSQNDTKVDNEVMTNIAGATDLGRTAGDTGFIFDTYGANLPTNAANALRGWYCTVSVDNVAREGDTYRIVSNSTTQINLDRGLDAALADNDFISVFSPWYVRRTTATTDPLFGIAMGTVTAGNYCWIQTQGLHTQARVRTGTVAWTVNATLNTTTLPYLTPSATAGALAFATITAGAATAAQLTALIRCKAFPLNLMTGTTDATRSVAVMLGNTNPGD